MKVYTDEEQEKYDEERREKEGLEQWNIGEMQGKILEQQDARDIVIVRRYLSESWFKINTLYDEMSEMRDKVGCVHDRMKEIEKRLGIMVDRVSSRKRQWMLKTGGTGKEGDGENKES